MLKEESNLLSHSNIHQKHLDPKILHYGKIVQFNEKRFKFFYINIKN